jgi:hypothetical protein
LNGAADKVCSANYPILKYLVDGCKDSNDEKASENLKALRYFWKNIDFYTDFERSFIRYLPPFNTANINKFNSQKDSDVKFIVDGMVYDFD